MIPTRRSPSRAAPSVRHITKSSAYLTNWPRWRQWSSQSLSSSFSTTFANNGEIGDPWDTPWSLGTTVPPSKTPTRSHPLSSCTHPSIVDALLHQFHELRLGNSVEERLDVGVYHPARPSVHRLPYLLTRLVRTPLRPKPVRALPKIHLEDRLQHQLRCCLHDPIPNRRYPQRSLSPVCLRDHHPPHRLRAISSLSQLGRQLRQKLRYPLLLYGAGGLPIYSRRPRVRLHLLPCPRQDVLAVHLVVERVEPPRRTRLRGPIQCPLKVSHLIWGVVSLRIHQCFPPSSTPTKCGPFPPRALPRFSSTMGRSDSRSALPHFVGNSAYRVRRSQSTTRVGSPSRSSRVPIVL
ncbi:MAG: hypothetical protein HW416_1773 [Chloroflexi bacterium]|nr:hypothetical protein [Chloroflexota bacterium]